MKTILVTGATGYVGGRLIPRLLEEGHRVRVLVRDPARVRGRPWTDRVEIHEGDLLSPATLKKAFGGVETAYYLVHSMLAGKGFGERDRAAASHFIEAATGVRHVIYLGGLMPKGVPSEHLRSRSEVGRILREALPTTEFRAGTIIGSGSASFEMIRYLTERLPIMIAPKWIKNAIQPIAIRDILSYLVAALRAGPSGIVEVGAAPLPFREMMLQYAEVRGFKRRIYPVPFLLPGLAARWVGLVTPIPNSMAVPIIEGMVSPLLADTARARELFPDIQPMPYRNAVELALGRTLSGKIETSWSGAFRGPKAPYVLKDEEGLIREIRSLNVHASPEALFRAFSSLGGERGWLAWNLAWSVRGAIDKILGGPGLRRGRRDPHELFPGESIDFWRVEEVSPGRMLRLRAEMKVPGKAWLQWEALSAGSGTKLIQTAYFAPKGLWGMVYWYALYPIHSVIFSALARKIVKAAESATSSRARAA